MIFFFIFLLCLLFIVYHGIKDDMWVKISDSIWISKDKRFKIYYSTNYWLWILIDEKRNDLQTLESLESCKNCVKIILSRETTDKSPK